MKKAQENEITPSKLIIFETSTEILQLVDLYTMYCRTYLNDEQKKCLPVVWQKTIKDDCFYTSSIQTMFTSSTFVPGQGSIVDVPDSLTCQLNQQIKDIFAQATTSPLTSKISQTICYNHPDAFCTLNSLGEKVYSLEKLEIY